VRLRKPLLLYRRVCPDVVSVMLIAPLAAVPRRASGAMGRPTTTRRPCEIPETPEVFALPYYIGAGAIII
jgi:hypothetical protein